MNDAIPEKRRFRCGPQLKAEVLRPPPCCKGARIQIIPPPHPTPLPPSPLHGHIYDSPWGRGPRRPMTKGLVDPPHQASAVVMGFRTRSICWSCSKSVIGTETGK